VIEEDEQVKTSTKPSFLAPRNRPLPFPTSSKRGRAIDEENEGAAAKRSHLDEDFMEEKEMSDLLNTSQGDGEEDNSDIAEEDITKLLDDEKDVSSSMVVLPVLEEVLEKALWSVWEENESGPMTVVDEVLEKVLGSVWEENQNSPMSPIFALSGKSMPFVRNTPSSMRRHGSHRRLHDSGLAESEGELEEDDGVNVSEEVDVFISNQDQANNLVARPVPFKQERGWTVQEPESSHSTADSLKPKPALATLCASNISSKSDFAAHPVLKDYSTSCDYDKEAEDDLTYQAILDLLRR